MAKVCVIGSINMDLAINTPHIPVLGESVIGNGFTMSPGGKGANQAVAAARLGADVVMGGCVGKDFFGRLLIDNLKKNTVNTSFVQTNENIPTGIALITIMNGDNSIVVDPGANFLISPGFIENMENEIISCDILVLQLEIPQDAVEKAIDIAKKHNIKVLLNPAPAREIPDELMKKVDIFTPNESECAFFSNINIQSVNDARKAVHYFLNKEVRQVIVTMGSKGVAYNRGNEFVHKLAREVEAVDTTAAGDSFSAALACMLADGKDIVEAVDFANVVGSLTVTKKGAQPSLPTKEQAEKEICQNRKKINN